MKRKGHRSHASGMRRFIRVYRQKQERQDLARFMQQESVLHNATRKVTQTKKVSKKSNREETTFIRFARKVIFAGDCWIWTGGRSDKSRGYGQFRDEFQRRRQAHCFSYEFFVGPIPNGLELDHYICHTEACVNPQHVEPVTHEENVLRGKRIVSCLHGHRARSHCKICTQEYFHEYGKNVKNRSNLLDKLE